MARVPRRRLTKSQAHKKYEFMAPLRCLDCVASKIIDLLSLSRIVVSTGKKMKLRIGVSSPPKFEGRLPSELFIARHWWVRPRRIIF